jgi:aromatic ring-opening dioxygenase LigB subunit
MDENTCSAQDGEGVGLGVELGAPVDELVALGVGVGRVVGGVAERQLERTSRVTIPTVVARRGRSNDVHSTNRKHRCAEDEPRLRSRFVSGTVSIGIIAPHGDLAIPEACDDTTRSLAVATQRAMEQMARRVVAAGADTTVVATPHNVHVVGHMAVLTSSQVAGRLDEAANPVELTAPVDRDLALAVLDSMNGADVPTVAISFGGNDPAEAVSPLDWGALVPLWHISRHRPEVPVVVVVPARDLDAASHVRAGAAIVRGARQAGRRIAIIASADQGHGHSAEGRYGFHAESAEFDARVAEAVQRGALEELVAYDPADVRAAMADSWWQMLMLHGALEEDGGDFRADLLAYEAPTYYGMLTAVFDPPAAER